MCNICLQKETTICVNNAARGIGVLHEIDVGLSHFVRSSNPAHERCFPNLFHNGFPTGSPQFSISSTWAHKVHSDWLYIYRQSSCHAVQRRQIGGEDGPIGWRFAPGSAGGEDERGAEAIFHEAWGEFGNDERCNEAKSTCLDDEVDVGFLQWLCLNFACSEDDVVEQPPAIGTNCLIERCLEQAWQRLLISDIDSYRCQNRKVSILSI
jgi:hypothetical protein